MFQKLQDKKYRMKTSLIYKIIFMGGKENDVGLKGCSYYNSANVFEFSFEENLNMFKKSSNNIVITF